MMEKFVLEMNRNDEKKSNCKCMKNNHTKVEDFDKIVPIVQVQMGKFGVRDVLLDGEFRMNIF